MKNTRARAFRALGVSVLALAVSAGPALAHPGDDHEHEPVAATGVEAAPAADIELLFETVEVAPSAESGSLAAERFGTWGIDRSQNLLDVRPGNDFFRHVNGRWLDSFEIPADRGDYGSFNALGELSDRRVAAIIEQAAATRGATGSLQQIGALYASFMDTARIERLGLAPLQPAMDLIASARTPEALALLLARTPGMPMAAPVGVGVDRRDTNRHQVVMGQGGLGLPDRDFYLSDGSNFPAVRDAYRAYMTQLLVLSGASQADAAARVERVIAYETEIARVHWTRAENRDPTRTLNTRTVAQLQQQFPGLPWTGMMTAMGMDLSQVADVNVAQVSAVQGMARLWAATPVETLQDWARLRVLSGSADFLPQAFRDARFAFQRVQTGQTEERSRDKRGVDLVGGVMGDAIGQIYVAQYFPPEAQVAIDQLVDNVREAFRARIDNLAWMGPETRAQAHAKLDAFTVKIGVPEVWDDLSSVRISRTDLIGNLQRVAAWARADNIADLSRPVDKREWGMSPQTVNAYYSPLNNEIVFPAAILQPPFFDFEADPAVNYGGIGAVIGHEILHGFDDQGRRFDASGTQRDWWTAEDAARFGERADQLVAQYNTYEPLPGLFVQGRVSLGENIADLGGLTVALDAYRRSLGGQAAPVIEGMTGEQRFFMGWAQVWRFKARDETMRRRVATAPHSPPQFRVNGVVRNIDAWYEAFDVQPGDALYLPPEQRVRLW